MIDILIDMAVNTKPASAAAYHHEEIVPLVDAHKLYDNKKKQIGYDLRLVRVG
jgi:hypothetical protein